jgi:hypothetical protein
VLIKTILEADNLSLGTDERLELNCGGDLNAVVTIEPAKTTGKFTCTALGDVTPSAKVAMALTGNDPQTVSRVDRYLKAAEGRLSSHLSRTLRVLMWRRCISVAYSRRVFKGAFWSLGDGQQWNPIHGLLQGRLSVEPEQGCGPVSPATVVAVGTLVASGQDEPLARQLLREAWAQKDRSQRSALVLAIAAVEVGLKHCISALVPDARWLVENVPTPPLHKMLTEYLPLLPVRTVSGKFCMPPDNLLDEIRTGVELRNRVVHLGHVKMTAEKLDRLLRGVSDLLWILDTYQGHEWAMHYVDAVVLDNWKRLRFT